MCGLPQRNRVPHCGAKGVARYLQGLAHQHGNQVTLSYGKESFMRLKERNAKRIQDWMDSGKVKALFNSNLVEFKPDAVVVDVSGSAQEIANDFVWIFAGGTPPTDFLKKIGVEFGMRDMTLEASQEARQATLAGQRRLQAQAAVQ